MASLSNSRWKNGKECPNISTNNGDKVHRPKCYVVCEGLSESVGDTVVKRSRASKFDFAQRAFIDKNLVQN